MKEWKKSEINRSVSNYLATGDISNLMDIPNILAYTRFEAYRIEFTTVINNFIKKLGEIVMKFCQLDFDVQNKVIENCYSDLWESDLPVTEEYVQFRVRQLNYDVNGNLIEEHYGTLTFEDWLASNYELSADQFDVEDYDFQQKVLSEYKQYLKKYA